MTEDDLADDLMDRERHERQERAYAAAVAAWHVRWAAEAKELRVRKRASWAALQQRFGRKVGAGRPDGGG